MLDYKIEVQNYQGPFDVLLSLIRKQEIEITELNLLDIINQYVNLIDDYQEKGVDLAAEYIDMASELIKMKSIILLPKEIIQEDEEYMTEEDLRQNLIKRLITYKKFKDASNDLEDLQEQRGEIYTKEASDVSDLKTDKWDKSLDINKLTLMMNSVLKKVQMEELHKDTKVINATSISIEEAQQYILFEIKDKDKNFYDLISNKTKSDIVAIFMSILELAKLGSIKILFEEENVIIGGTNER